MQKHFIGFDIGTQGARVILVNQEGLLVSAAEQKFILDDMFRQEQPVEGWWDACLQIMDTLLAELPAGFDRASILATSVTSTSGTVIPLDKNMNPLSTALMYSDPRSADQGRRIKNLARNHVPNGYTGFNASSGISKMLWFVENNPQKVSDIALWVHASDYIVGKLSDNFAVTDYTNVLKSGYDLEKLEWPPYITQKLGIKKSWLQAVVPSGTVVGKLNRELARRWGIPQIDVVVGLTDGCASQMASGAVSLGTWNTTIGTTLVIKGVTKNAIVDPLGGLYSHRHPEGYWMPGGASNTGADWISLDFSEGLSDLNEQAAELIPTGQIAWPLKQQGERYPIVAPQARAIIPEGLSREEHYAANLEGVAFLERLAYELIEELAKEKVMAVYTAGGGSNSDVWLRIRASVLNVPIYKCKETSGALGAAIVAASMTYYKSLGDAAKNMTSVEKEVLAEPRLVAAYQEQYVKFKLKFKELEYL